MVYFWCVHCKWCIHMAAETKRARFFTADEFSPLNYFAVGISLSRNWRFQIMRFSGSTNHLSYKRGCDDRKSHSAARNWSAANSKCFHANEEFRAQPFPPSSPPTITLLINHWRCFDTNFVKSNIEKKKKLNISFECAVYEIIVPSFPGSLDSPTNNRFPLYCQKMSSKNAAKIIMCSHWKRFLWNEKSTQSITPAQRPYNYLVKSEIAHIVFLIISNQHSFIFRNCLR